MIHSPPSSAPRFSIVIPSFNAVQYIGETLLSIFKQDFASVEVIVIDGGSTDGTLDIVRKFERLAIRLVCEPDRGQLDAVQKGIMAARGEIVYWLNADDLLMPGSLRAVDDAFAADPALDLVFSDDFAFDTTRRMLVRGGLIKGLSYDDHILFYRQMYSECIFWRRERTRYLPESDYDLRVTTDYAFFLHLRRGLKERWLAKRLGAFRIVENQMSSRMAERLADEFARVRRDAYRRSGWSDRTVIWRRALHWPSFYLRQVVRPAAYALGRAVRRRLDGGIQRSRQNEAFFDDWLDPRQPASPALEKILWR